MGFAFISHKSEEIETVNKIKALLESQSFETWISEAGILGSESYAAVLNEAVQRCECFVLVLTDASQNSKWVRKELDIALGSDKPILPIMTERLVLTKSFEFYLCDIQIIEAFDLDSEIVQKKITDSLSLIMGNRIDIAQPNDEQSQILTTVSIPNDVTELINRAEIYNSHNERAKAAECYDDAAKILSVSSISGSKTYYNTILDILVKRFKICTGEIEEIKNFHELCNKANLKFPKGYIPQLAYSCELLGDAYYLLASREIEYRHHLFNNDYYLKKLEEEEDEIRQNYNNAHLMYSRAIELYEQAVANEDTAQGRICVAGAYKKLATLLKKRIRQSLSVLRQEP